MAITAAVLYGLGDAVSEFSVKHIDRMELLGMLGLFGMILTGLLFPIRDYSALQTLFADLAYNVMPLFLIICYVCLLLLYYITEASFFVASDATLLNLSLQAQNLWAILFSVVTYQSAPPLLFYVALMLVFVGVFVYEGMSTVGILGLTATADAVVSRENNIELEGSEGALVSTTDQGGEDDSNQRVRSQGNKKYNSIQQSELV